MKLVSIKVSDWLKEVVIYKQNDIKKNYELLKKSVEDGDAVTFKYVNAWEPHNQPNPENNKSLSAEIFTIGEHKSTGNLIARGFLTAGKSNRNNPIKWRTFLLSNMKDVRILPRKARLVRSLYHSPDQKMSKIFVDLINYYVPSMASDKFKKRTDKYQKQGQVKSTRIMGKREEDKSFNQNKTINKKPVSIFSPPKEEQIEDEEEGSFED